MILRLRRAIARRLSELADTIDPEHRVGVVHVQIRADTASFDRAVADAQRMMRRIGR